MKLENFISNDPIHFYLRVGLECLAYLNNQRQKKISQQGTKIQRNSIQSKNNYLRNKFSSKINFPNLKDIEIARKKFIDDEL